MLRDLRLKIKRESINRLNKWVTWGCNNSRSTRLSFQSSLSSFRGILNYEEDKCRFGRFLKVLYTHSACEVPSDISDILVQRIEHLEYVEKEVY